MNIQIRGTAPGGTRLPQDNMRRLTVRGGDCHAFPVGAGDSFEIINAEGLQPAFLLVLAAKTSAIDGKRETIDLDAILAPHHPYNGVIAPLLSKHGLDPRRLDVLKVFDENAGADERRTYEATDDATCVLFVPGSDMKPDEQNSSTDVVVEITTVKPVAGIEPTPLAAPLQDIRIKAASARAYKVKKGDYIQIIDVDGRQCSDFLAFDAAALEEGKEFGLDHTVTHTYMGSAYPGPGLHSKYYDSRTMPLIEIVQDTVGRHDTFMLACSAKYYDDLGYPGHSNCTDNFNAVLRPLGIQPRAGWPAINFFFNTSVDGHNRITSDAPWSRAGDYVLVRALTDLVCASSSCADDVDPSNGWLPTDIHVFVYDGSCNFKKGNAHRMTPDSEPRLTRETAFHERTSALTRKFEDYRGFWLASCYSSAGPTEEYWACRERAVVMDLSALRKFEVTGPDAEALMQLATTRNIKKLTVGQVVYTALCYDNGGMLDDGTIFRLGQNNFRLVCGDDYCGQWLRELARKHGLNAFVRNSTDHLCNISVQGPKSREILSSLIYTPAHQQTVQELKWFRFTVGRLGGELGVPLLVSRTGYTGELGFEVWCHPKDASAVWDAVWTAGEPHGMKPMGLAALDIVRIEAGLVFANIDFSSETDPYESGIGFAVAKDKADPFIGGEALARRAANPMRRFIGLDVDGADPIHHGDPVFVGRAQVGIVTSAARSPLLGKTIAFARVDLSAAEPGTTLEIGKLDGLQKRIPARVVEFPHYDPTKSRVRA